MDAPFAIDPAETLGGFVGRWAVTTIKSSLFAYFLGPLTYSSTGAPVLNIPSAFGTTSLVPIPGSVIPFLSGLIGLVIVKRKKK